jgi:hypothetical protein
LGSRLLGVSVLAVCAVRLRCNELLVTLSGLPCLCSLGPLNRLGFFSSRRSCWPGTVLDRSPHETLERVGLEAICCIAHCIPCYFFGTRLRVPADGRVCVGSQKSVLLRLSLALLLLDVDLLHSETLVILFLVDFLLAILLLHLLLSL